MSGLVAVLAGKDVVPREIVGVDASAGTETKARELTSKTGVIVPRTLASDWPCPNLGERERRLCRCTFRLMVMAVPWRECLAKPIVN